jgi:hypothetical protein
MRVHVIPIQNLYNRLSTTHEIWNPGFITVSHNDLIIVLHITSVTVICINDALQQFAADLQLLNLLQFSTLLFHCFSRRSVTTK